MSITHTPPIVNAPFPEAKLDVETNRLHQALGKLGWARSECELYAPITLEIRQLAEEKNATILAHSYQTPDIQFGVADYRGDSLGLSQEAAATHAEIIVFCGVKFMAETAKVLAPEKTVLLPAPDAGCSLDESITPEDVRQLKAAHPGLPVVCYVNTSAAVKAEVDVCCTSANAAKIIASLPDKKIIYIPDANMARNLAKETDKEILSWKGHCMVHVEFTPEQILALKERDPEVQILAHTECPEEVINVVDMAGGTGDMIRYIRDEGYSKFMLVTECGLSDRMRVEFPDAEFTGSCILCPHMRKVELRKVLQALKDPAPDQVIELDPEVIEGAGRSIRRMMEFI